MPKMFSVNLVFYAFLVCCLLSTGDCIFEWLFGAEGPEIVTKTGAELIIGSKAGAFEMTTADEKFLVQAKGLSVLDTCNHMVISQLKQSSCSKLSEEDLGKLSVQLLNCQSEVEKRTTYKCTKDMTISECTKDMEPATWNSYQIVSNRARALCYSVRQQQFRIKTEQTVNHLLSTTQEQLKSMEHLQEGQEKLGEVTSDTLRKVFDGQQELIGQQILLRDVQHNIHIHMSANLLELKNEKAMIAAGNAELSQLTEKIKTKLDLTSQQLMNQKFTQKQNHEEILNDLAAIRNKSQNVWKKIDSSSKLILRYHEEAVEHYQTSLQNLQRVNETVSYIMNSIEQLGHGLDQRFGWLGSLIDTTGDKLSLVTTCVIHLLYFFLAAVSAAFLHIPTTSRAVLLLVVPLNAMSEVQCKKSLDFFSLTLFILGITLVYYMLVWIYHRLLKSDRIHVTRSWCEASHSPVQEARAITDASRNESPFGTPDLKQLSSLLNKFQKSADRTCHFENNNSRRRESTPVLDDQYISNISANTSFPDPGPANSTAPTPLSSSGDHTAVDEDTFTTAQLYASPKITTVKRHLLDSLNTRNTPSPRAQRQQSRSRSSTPLRGVGPYKSGSPMGSPNTSYRAPCCSLTKNGQPCKLPAVEGKDSCFRHVQKTNLNHSNF